MSAINQGIARKKLTLIIGNAIAGSEESDLITNAYDNAPLAFDGAPAVVVKKNGIGRKYQGVGTQKFANLVKMKIQIFVPAASKEAETTPQNVDDSLDAIEAAIADVISANQYISGFWIALYYEEGSISEVFDTIYLDGNPYRMEELYVIAEVMDA